MNDIEVLRICQRLCATPEAHHLAHGTRFAQRQRERPADQPDTEDDDFFE